MAPGAHRGMRGRGGVRCAALSDGVLRVGPAVLRSPVPLDPSRAGAAARPALEWLARGGTGADGCRVEEAHAGDGVEGREEGDLVVALGLDARG